MRWHQVRATAVAVALLAAVACGDDAAPPNRPEDPGAPAPATDAGPQTPVVCAESAACVANSGGAPVRQVCRDGLCEPCLSTEECADHGEGMECRGGLCLRPCAGGGCECSAAAPCGAGFTCSAEGRCWPTACTSSPGSDGCPCADAVDCASDLRCVLGACGPCPAGGACDCATHGDCAPDQGCYSQACATCPHGLPGCPCDEGACTQGECNHDLDVCIGLCPEGTPGCPCAFAGQCGTGLVCDPSSSRCVSCEARPGVPGCPCMADDRCDFDAVCDTDTNTCLPCPWGAPSCPCRVGYTCDGALRCDVTTRRCEACASDSCACATAGDCPTGHLCGPAYHCEPCSSPGSVGCSCDTAADCAGCASCVDGACLLVTSVPSQDGCPCGPGPQPCAAGLVCAAGSCHAPCSPGAPGCPCAAGTCAGGATCTDDICVPCAPDCDGKLCGPDGCGGSCGECPTVAQVVATVALAGGTQTDGLLVRIHYDPALLAPPTAKALSGLPGALVATNTATSGLAVVAAVGSATSEPGATMLQLTFGAAGPVGAPLSALVTVEKATVATGTGLATGPEHVTLTLEAK